MVMPLSSSDLQLATMALVASSAFSAPMALLASALLASLV
jgi:hypothetical protein